MTTPLLMQPDPTGTTQPTTGSSGGGSGSAPTGAGSQLQMFLPLVLMFLVFYFLMLRPQQKKQRETDDMLKALKKGDVVRTSGGIRGEITDITEGEVTLLIADKVKINVLRSHVANKDAAAAKEKA